LYIAIALSKHTGSSNWKVKRLGYHQRNIFKRESFIADAKPLGLSGI
jgi:hypothetical protein